MSNYIDKASVTSLAAFFEEFAKLRASAQAVSSGRELAPAALENFFGEFSALAGSRGSGAGEINIFQVCGVGRDEPRNCRILAWLLDANTSHGMGNAFLGEALAACGLEPVSSAAYMTRTELCPNGDNADRLDIVCDGPDFLYYFEVKIDSLEHGEQTDRYYKRLKTNAGSRKNGLIFISPSILPANPEARFLSWRDLAGILEKLAGAREALGEVFLADTLRQYAGFAKKF